ncbi:hypothetical protein INT45_006723, partial [Circinella minor]
TQAAIIPHFFAQNDDPVYEASTDLIKHCGDDNDLLTIKEIKLNPDPPRAGEKLTVDFKGTLKEDVSDGTTIEVTVKYGVVQLIKKKFDFCDEASKIDEECPIKKGELNITKDVDLPKEIRKLFIIGRYSVHAVIVTPDEKQVTCLDGRMSFPRHR